MPPRYPSFSGRYLPSDDTRLLSRALSRYSGKACLEIGFGSGAVLGGLAERFSLAVGTDVSSLAEARLSSAPDKVVLADRATCFRDSVFDLVAFNPPYLPSEGIEDPTVDGGEGGVEVSREFLREAARVMKPDGKIVALLSRSGQMRRFTSACEELGLEAKLIAEERLFFEELVVFEVARSLNSFT